MKLESLISKAKVKRCGSANYPVLSMTMHDGIVEQVNRFKKTIASKDTSSYKIVEPGQLVVGFPIDEGVIYVQGHDFVGIMSPAYNVWDIDRSKIHPAYLELALHSTRSMAYYADKMRGTTARRRSITDGNLLALEIPLPTLQAQNEIVSNLHQVNEIAAASKRRMEVLDDLVKSRFIEMFGDPCKPSSRNFQMAKINELCELRIGPFGSSLHKEDYVEDCHPIVNPSHIINGRITIDRTLTVKEEKYASMAPYHLHTGDVVLGRRGEIGRCAAVDTEGLLCGTGSMILRPISDICRSDYLQRVISFPTFASSLEHEAVGVTMKNLNTKIVGNAVIALPPLTLQQQFADFVTQVDKLRFVCTCLIRNYGTHHDKIP